MKFNWREIVGQGLIALGGLTMAVSALMFFATAVTPQVPGLLEHPPAEPLMEAFLAGVALFVVGVWINGD